MVLDTTTPSLDTGKHEASLAASSGPFLVVATHHYRLGIETDMVEEIIDQTDHK